MNEFSRPKIYILFIYLYKCYRKDENNNPKKYILRQLSHLCAYFQANKKDFSLRTEDNSLDAGYLYEKSMINEVKSKKKL